jgi:hypothetical protein
MSFSDDPKYAEYGYFDEISEIKLDGEKLQITKSFAEYLRWQNDKNRKENLAE